MRGTCSTSCCGCGQTGKLGWRIGGGGSRRTGGCRSRSQPRSWDCLCAGMPILGRRWRRRRWRSATGSRAVMSPCVCGYRRSRAQQHPVVAPRQRDLVDPRQSPFNESSVLRRGNRARHVRRPCQTRLALRHPVPRRFIHVDYHALHHDRFRTSGAQIHAPVEIRDLFRLISYWKRLRL